MSAPPDELLRWRDGGDDEHALRARAADLVDAARDVPALGSVAVERIRSEVLVRNSRGVASTFGGLPFGLRFAVVACLVLLSVATAKGTATLWRRYVAPATKAETPIEPARSTAPGKRGSRARAGQTSGQEAPTAEPAIAEAATTSAPPATNLGATPTAAPTTSRTVALAAPVRSRSPGATPQATAQPRAAPDVTPPAQAAPALDVSAGRETEAHLLARAFLLLRQANDPRGALALLDRYAETFPHGVLESEALRARLEAVLQLDDRTTALALLDERRALSGRLGAELRLIRAELRASAGRHAEARADFDVLLGPASASAHLPPSAIERALYGRAVCLGHLNQDDRARADLRRYLARFPEGKFAAEVARLLENGTPKDRL